VTADPACRKRHGAGFRQQTTSTDDDEEPGVRFVLIGPPGSGKGTQASRLSERYGVPTVSFGEVFSAHKEEGTELGQKAGEHMDAGELVPDEIVVSMARERLAESDVANGFLLDGFPRTEPQAEELEKILADAGTPLDAAVYLQVPDDVVVERIAQRSESEDRSDDDEKTVRNRLRVFSESTAPLLEYYRQRQLLVEVDGAGSTDEVFERIVGDLPD
jgi:adenylate kinase